MATLPNVKPPRAVMTAMSSSGAAAPRALPARVSLPASFVPYPSSRILRAPRATTTRVATSTVTIDRPSKLMKSDGRHSRSLGSTSCIFRTSVASPHSSSCETTRTRRKRTKAPRRVRKKRCMEGGTGGREGRLRGLRFWYFGLVVRGVVREQWLFEHRPQLTHRGVQKVERFLELGTDRCHERFSSLSI